MSYTKLDHGITESTIWYAPDTTRLVWITMLSMADQHGYVGASIPGLAGKARVPLPDCLAALESFLGPDEFSRTKDFEGRRIAVADGGWVLLNHAKYLAKQSAEDRRERARVAMANIRANRKQQKLTVNKRKHALTPVTSGDDSLPVLPHVAVAVAETGNKATSTALAPSATRTTPEEGSATPIILLPLNAVGENYTVTEAQAVEFITLYPAVNVRQELRAMRGWLISNPTKRKTRTGILRYVNAWLAKAQNQPNSGAINGTRKLSAVEQVEAAIHERRAAETAALEYNPH